MRSCCLLMIVCSCLFGKAQKIATDTIGNLSSAANVYNHKAFGDSLCTSFVITVKNEVKAHRHQQHSEHILVLDGEASMRLGEERFAIKKGDLVFIPANTVHSVTVKGKKPLKVLSIQAPHFDGRDRIIVEP